MCMYINSTNRRGITRKLIPDFLQLSTFSPIMPLPFNYHQIRIEIMIILTNIFRFVVLNHFRQLEIARNHRNLLIVKEEIEKINNIIQSNVLEETSVERNRVGCEYLCQPIQIRSLLSNGEVTSYWSPRRRDDMPVNQLTIALSPNNLPDTVSGWRNSRTHAVHREKGASGHKPPGCSLRTHAGAYFQTRSVHSCPPSKTASARGGAPIHCDRPTEVKPRRLELVVAQLSKSICKSLIPDGSPASPASLECPASRDRAADIQKSSGRPSSSPISTAA